MLNLQFLIDQAVKTRYDNGVPNGTAAGVGVIQLPAGTFDVPPAVLVPSGCWLRGMGTGTRLVCERPLLRIDSKQDHRHVSQVTISDMVIDCPHPLSVTANVGESAGITIDNVMFRRGGCDLGELTTYSLTFTRNVGIDLERPLLRASPRVADIRGNRVVNAYNFADGATLNELGQRLDLKPRPFKGAAIIDVRGPATYGTLALNWLEGDPGVPFIRAGSPQEGWPAGWTFAKNWAEPHSCIVGRITPQVILDHGNYDGDWLSIFPSVPVVVRDRSKLKFVHDQLGNVAEAAGLLP